MPTESRRSFPRSHCSHIPCLSCGWTDSTQTKGLRFIQASHRLFKNSSWMPTKTRKGVGSLSAWGAGDVMDSLIKPTNRAPWTETPNAREQSHLLQRAPVAMTSSSPDHREYPSELLGMPGNESSEAADLRITVPSTHFLSGEDRRSIHQSCLQLWITNSWM